MRTISCLILLLLPHFVLAEGPDNFANYWNHLAPGEKVAYLEGYEVGISEAVFEMVSVYNSPDYNEKTPIRDQTTVLGIFEVEDTDTLIKVISNLYEDPGNSYIQINDMIHVAIEKLFGNPTESALENARRKAIRADELKREMTNKDK